MLTPLNETIILKEVKETETSSGFAIPENKEKSSKGVVICSGCSDIELKKDDVVHFIKYAQDVVEYDWQEYLVVQKKSLLCKE